MLVLTLILGLALIVTSLAQAQNTDLADADQCSVEANGDMTDTNPLAVPPANNGGPPLPAGAVMPAPALDHTLPGEWVVTTGQLSAGRPQGTGWGISAYEIPFFRLTVSRAGSGTGTVTGPGIDCGADCDEFYIYGAAVILTATAGITSTFSGWSGDCSGNAANCTLVFTVPRDVTAVFGLPRVLLPLVFKEP